MMRRKSPNQIEKEQQKQITSGDLTVKNSVDTLFFFLIAFASAYITSFHWFAISLTINIKKKSLFRVSVCGNLP